MGKVFCIVVNPSVFLPCSDVFQGSVFVYLNSLCWMRKPANEIIFVSVWGVLEM